MKRAGDIDRFLADPVGRYYLGETHAVWCASPSLCGSASWGRHTEQHARDLCRLYDVSRHPALRAGFDVFMDSGAIEAFDWHTFMILGDYVRSRLAEWGKVIRKHAVIVPSGPSGLIMSGLIPMLGMTYPIRFFHSPGEAMGWLDRDDLRNAVEEVDRLLDEARGLSAVVRSLRGHLEKSLLDASVEGAARALGVTPRSLQRELKRSGTGFSAELARARVRAASALLAHSEEKIEVIARRVGCSSSSHLATLFRKAVGETPAQFRARHQQPA
ncbi:MAG: helix-turn-helix domain-containing protein [Myxococcales bacterium]